MLQVQIEPVGLLLTVLCPFDFSLILFVDNDGTYALVDPNYNEDTT